MKWDPLAITDPFHFFSKGFPFESWLYLPYIRYPC